MISVDTPKGKFKVWTRRVAATPRPRFKLLLLHGGPGMTHECFEVLEAPLVAAGVELYFYDQLGSGRSDRPDEPDLWEVSRFVDEVEQVRRALALDAASFYLLGHSWGGILAIEYALQYQQHIKGLIISNMMASSAAYNRYFEAVLLPSLVAEVAAAGESAKAAGQTPPDPRELLSTLHSTRHMLHAAREHWPAAVQRSFDHINLKVTSALLGDDEFRIGGRLANWNRVADLPRIAAPTLVIGARHDTMDPAHLQRMASQVQNGRYLYCPNGSHFAMYDDQSVYVDGLLRFLHDVDAAG